MSLKPSGVRWGKVRELDGRARLKSPVYNAYPTRLKQLHCWRRMHKVAGSHMPIRMVGTRARIRPSSDLPLKMKEAYLEKRD